MNEDALLKNIMECYRKSGGSIDETDINASFRIEQRPESCAIQLAIPIAETRDNADEVLKKFNHHDGFKYLIEDDSLMLVQNIYTNGPLPASYLADCMSRMLASAKLAKSMVEVWSDGK